MKFEGKYFYKLIRSKGWQHASWRRTQNKTLNSCMWCSHLLWWNGIENHSCRTFLTANYYLFLLILCLQIYYWQCLGFRFPKKRHADFCFKPSGLYSVVHGVNALGLECSQTVDTEMSRNRSTSSESGFKRINSRTCTLRSAWLWGALPKCLATVVGPFSLTCGGGPGQGLLHDVCHRDVHSFLWLSFC